MVNFMLLYHFTAKNRLNSILESGLWKGDIPITPLGAGLNAVWLTTDPIGDEHGLGALREISPAERLAMLQWKGEQPAEGVQWSDKREVRITLKISSSDPRLKNWMPWARKRLDSEWFGDLVRTGGGKRKAETWRIYFGIIPPSEFVRVDIRENGIFVPYVKGGNICFPERDR
jgi:hypothetical protein